MHKKTDIDTESHECQTAFENRVKRWQGPLFGYLGRLGFSAVDAEELAQETFLKAWRWRANYDESKGQYSTWLFRIARNVAYDERSRCQKRPTSSPDMTVEDLHSNDNAADLQQVTEIEQRLQSALLRLSVADRDTIALACTEELSSQQAALLFKCTPETFRTRLSRARQRLKELLESTDDDK